MKRTGWVRWWPFVALCTVAALRWAMTSLWPASAPTMASSAVGAVSACMFFLTLATRSKAKAPRPRTAAASMAAGALMLCGPAAAILLRVRGMEGASVTLALALTPVVVAVARTGFRQTEGGDFAGRMWPGLAAVGGLMLILPQPELASWREDAALALAPLATGIGAAWLRTRHADESWRGACALGGAALLFAAAAGWHSVEWQSLLLAAAIDGLIATLSVLALFRLGMTRWSAQFAVVPLAVLLEGLATVRPRMDARVGIGLGLVLAASVFLLLPPKVEGDEKSALS